MTKEKTRVRLTAMNLLARREHSIQEMQKKLGAKSFDPNLIQIVINELLSENLLSNERFCEAYIRSRRNRGYGPLRISMELQTRGISHDMIEENLDLHDNQWLIEARAVLKKRFKVQAHDYLSKSKQMRFLQYRGFSHEHIKQIFHSEAEYE